MNATIGIADGDGAEIRFELAYDHGLGFLYTLVTEFLGFDTHGEYKVMGLAPYGAPIFAERLRGFSAMDAHGALRFNHGRLPWSELHGQLGTHLGIARRGSGDPIEGVHADLAASMQQLFEDAVFRMARFARQVTGESRLLFCGGCAQNCVAAGKLEALGAFTEVFTSPAAGDMGIGLGAALLYQGAQRKGDGKVDVRGLQLGSRPGAMPGDALDYQVNYEGDLVDVAARLLADGAIVGWVRGRMEYGARALGARSILANPAAPGMQSTLNQKTKGRESFRPFAPAILAEDISDWFDTADRSDYMQRVAWLKPERRFTVPAHFANWHERLSHQRCAVPAVVHVDFSARLQTVECGTHRDFHRLLTRFKALTGIPMLINTSFNVSGEPIVRTATDAWRCFSQTRMDYLIVDNQLFRHPRQADP